ncbi:MAG: ABC transporter permease subunit [Gracilibacteraceae bacterium]|jgi:peptide/nickel transport system permease protein|nr:ABC transporter permease subunit [Gracilibacteraceae bacterium]
MKKALRHPLFAAGFTISLLLCAIALFGRTFAPNDPLFVDLHNTLAPPGGAFPLGTDNLGRCVFSRLLCGARATLGSALMVELFTLTFGLFVGLIAGYFGKAADGVVLIVIDTLLAFPSIILALVIAGMLGAGLLNLMLALCAVYWVEHARMARSLTRSVRGQTFVLAAQASGSGSFSIILGKILPHILPPMIVYSALNASSLIIGISSLSFIGLGVRPPAPEWGASLNEARAYMDTNPQMLIAAIVCVLLAVAGFQLMAEGLRDVLSVRRPHVGIFRKRRRNAHGQLDL